MDYVDSFMDYPFAHPFHWKNQNPIHGFNRMAANIENDLFNQFQNFARNDNTVAGFPSYQTKVTPDNYVVEVFTPVSLYLFLLFSFSFF